MKQQNNAGISDAYRSELTDQAIIMLDRIAEYRIGLEQMELDRKGLIDQVVPQEVKDQVEEINKEFADKVALQTAEIAKLQDVVKGIVLELGTTVKASSIMAVWNKGRTTWKGDLLEGYAVAHPEVLACRQVGEPSVSFR